MKKIFCLLLCSTALFASAQKISLAGDTYRPSQDIYRALIAAFKQDNWDGVYRECNHMLKGHPESPFAQDARYYLAQALYKRHRFQESNDILTTFLSKEGSMKRFEEAMELKFRLANGYFRGKRDHLFGSKFFPCLLSVPEKTLSLYDEVITAMPRHDLAAKSLHQKGLFYLKNQDYKESLEELQALIRRFPKHPLAVEGYLSIHDVYLEKAQNEYANPDLLDLALINQRHFANHFPTEGRLKEGENKILQLKELLARDLMKVAAYYTKAKKQDAAKIYYSTIVARYPETPCAKKAQHLLDRS